MFMVCYCSWESSPRRLLPKSFRVPAITVTIWWLQLQSHDPGGTVHTTDSGYSHGSLPGRLAHSRNRSENPRDAWWCWSYTPDWSHQGSYCKYCKIFKSWKTEFLKRNLPVDELGKSIILVINKIISCFCKQIVSDQRLFCLHSTFKSGKFEVFRTRGFTSNDQKFEL